MPVIHKKHNYKSEEEFHDEWAMSIKPKDIDVYAQFEGSTSPEYKHVIGLLGDIGNKKILNLGSGLGEETVYLAHRGAQVIAIDISKQMLLLTEKLAKRYKIKKKITYKHANAEKLPFRDGTFDAVVGCNILHHIDIRKSVKEVRRVLKPGGIAVFSEPLIYNPIINIYRTMAHVVRTDGEHPLDYGDLSTIKKIFPSMRHDEFHFLTLLIFVWFYIGEHEHPNKARYWKKIITEEKKYRIPFTILFTLDKFLLTLLPFLRRYCWVTVIHAHKLR